MTDASDQSPLDSVKTPGQLLLQEREACNFSVQYVAEQLRLTESYILWLESDQFENLPPEPFVLGYYRAYARILNQSADGLIEAYHASRQQPATAGAPSKTTRRQEEALDEPKSTGINNRHYAIAVVALVVIWVLFSSLMNNDEASSSTTEPSAVVIGQESAQQSTQATDQDAPSKAEQASLAVSHDSEESVAKAAVEESSIAADSSQPAAAASAEQSQLVVSQSSNGSSLDQLVIRFTDECWLEVTDANDDVVAANLYQKGDDAQLQGVAPFTLMLGNVRAAQVSLNGKGVHMQPRGFRKTLRAYVFADGTSQTAE
ncbi:MAG: helix-turn-helix domain-containing protein [Cellvibrionaceae bacterium]